MRRLTASLATLWISAHSMPTGAVTILVESDGDVINGSVGSVADLLAASGPDGISLREAITATNNDPDQYTMHFATAEIQLTSALPPLTGGHLTIEGPVTLRGGPVMTPTPFDVGLRIASSGNRLVGLTLEGFFITGVAVSPPDGDQPGMTLADNVIEGLTIRGVHNAIFLGDAFSPTCGGQELCPSHNTFLRNTVRNNTIESDRFGIIAEAGRTVGGVFDSLTITGNTLQVGTVAEPNSLGAPIQVDAGGISASAHLSNILVSGNTIVGVQAGGDGAITIAAGLQRNHASVIEDVKVTGNRIHLIRPNGSVPCCNGIVVSAASDYFTYPPQTFPGSPDDNVVRRVEVSGNDISGELLFGGVRLQAGVDGGGSRNRVETARVSDNIIRSTIRNQGILLWIGQIGQGRTVTGNALTDIDIIGNDITTGEGESNQDPTTAGGIILLSGHDGGRNGSISDVRISANHITTSYAGVRLIGGVSPPGSSTPAMGNSIRCVRFTGNSLVGTTTALHVQANMGSALGNLLAFVKPDVGAMVAPELGAVEPTLLDLVATGCPGL